MKYKLLNLIVINILFSSCQQFLFKKEEINQNSDINFEDKKIEITKNVVDPSTNDFLLSANLREDLNESVNEYYFLYGAEHLNLKQLYYDIPVAYKDSVVRWIHFFQNRGEEFFRRYLARAGKYAPVLTKILKDQGLPLDLVYLAMAESGFHTKAVSRAYAVGAWQFMPYTGKKFGLEIDFFKDERMDPIKSTIAAGKYLARLYKEFGSWELAAAAYNAGEGKVRKAIKKYQTKNFWELRKFNYFKSETKEYVPKIMALAILTKNLEEFGIKEVEFHDPLDFDTIEVSSLSDLYKIADDLEISFDELAQLNPELLRWTTPIHESSYLLRVPVGKGNEWQQCCAQKEIEKYYKAKNFQLHYGQSNRRESLEIIAKKYKLSTHLLASLNNVSIHHSLKPNESILLPFRDNHSPTDPMYLDLYRKINGRKNNRWRNDVHLAFTSKPKRKINKSSREIAKKDNIYVVKKGDTLWGVSRKTGVAMDVIIKSNLSLVSAREIKPGDKLVLQ